VTPSRYYIIEHPLRGIVVDQDVALGREGYITKWSWSKARSEAMRFFYVSDAVRALYRVPDNDRAAAQILSSESWQPVEI
jgi:hypothetical protein